MSGGDRGEGEVRRVRRVRKGGGGGEDRRDERREALPVRREERERVGPSTTHKGVSLWRRLQQDGMERQSLSPAAKVRLAAAIPIENATAAVS